MSPPQRSHCRIRPRCSGSVLHAQALHVCQGAYYGMHRRTEHCTKQPPMHNTRKKTECKTLTRMVLSDLNHCANRLPTATSAGGLDEKVLTDCISSVRCWKITLYYLFYSTTTKRKHFILFFKQKVLFLLFIGSNVNILHIERHAPNKQ